MLPKGTICLWSKPLIFQITLNCGEQLIILTKSLGIVLFMSLCFPCETLIKPVNILSLV